MRTETTIITVEYEYRMPYSQTAWRTSITEHFEGKLSVGEKYGYRKLLALTVLTLTCVDAFEQNTHNKDIQADIEELVKGSFHDVKNYIAELKKETEADITPNQKNLLNFAVSTYRELVPLIKKVTAK